MKKEKKRKSLISRYRSAAETLGARMHKKLTEAVNWYRKEREKEERENDEDSYEEFKRETISNYRFKKKMKRSIKGKGRKKKEKWTEDDILNRIEKEERDIVVEKKEEKFQTVIFVQHTKHSRMAANIREKLKELEKVGRIKVKIVERCGTKIVDLITKSNLWGDKDCERDDCWSCSETNRGGKKGDCFKKNIVYETYCITCKEIEEKEENEKEEKEKKENNRKKDFKVKYIGESARSLYERSIEHMDDFNSLSEKSHMLKHYLIAHKDMKREEVKFGIKVRNRYKKAFERQIGEAISIEQELMKNTTLLNSKSEFNRCTVPRLTMTTYKETEEEIEKEEKEKKMLKEEIRKLKKRKKKQRKMFGT